MGDIIIWKIINFSLLFIMRILGIYLELIQGYINSFINVKIIRFLYRMNCKDFFKQYGH